MSTGGLSRTRLGRMHDVMAGFVERGEVPGWFGWDGGYGTFWSSDPREDMVAILMTQRLIFPEPSGIELDFRTSAYQAIDD